MKSHRTERHPFWETKSLDELTDLEWESLCDGCAQCCLYKIQDSDTEELFWTVVACRQLNVETCRCQSYANRMDIVEECVKVRELPHDEMYLLPETCAYRLVFEKKPLPEWHPLISGNRKTVHKADISVRGKVIPEQNIPPEDIENYIIGSPIKPI